MTAACATAPSAMDAQQAAAPVIEAERAFAARHRQVSVKQAFEEFSAPDGVAVRPAGTVNVKQDLAGWPDTNNAGFIEWWPAFAGIARSGDLGFTTGPASYGGGKSYGNYFTVWKKQPDGSWKWLIDQGAGQSNVAPPHTPGDPVAVVPVSTLPPIDENSALRQLLAAEAEIVRATAGDYSRLVDWLAPEVRLLGFTPHPSIGIDAAKAALAARPKQVTFKPGGGGVSKAGDLGWTYGQASWSEGGADRNGGYMRVWQRRGAGWRILADNLNAFGRG